MGRKRLEMKKIVREDALQVTFSKRKAGIFNKASEISILCGAHVLVVIFSPGGKLFMFGSPDANTMMQCFVTGDPMRPPNLNAFNDQIMMPHFTSELTEVSIIRDREKKYLSDLNKSLKECGMEEDNLDELGVDKLEVYISSLNQMRHKLVSYLGYLTTSNPNPNPPTSSAGLDPRFHQMMSDGYYINNVGGNAGAINDGSTFIYS